MVHVKKVEIFGFKSFGFKNTTVHFEPGLISISGPNGSGKSNILDAIMFAMGENRPKVMRVDRLMSLLHDIEKQRRGPRMARVNVTFDNSDRKIPVDSDTVDIARELDDKGENTYYLNKKQINRRQILDLLDVAKADLNRLNAVQQGTVTRISEFSSEEKRQTIEDLADISSYEQKKADAIKNLEEADRRVEVGLAKMGEAKKHIDELEEERNQKLRYDMIEREIGRLEAVSAAIRLGEIKESRSSKEADLDKNVAESKALGQQQEQVDLEIRRIESEKSTFVQRVDEYNTTKAKIDSEISAAREEHEAMSSKIAVRHRDISRIEKKIPEIEDQIGKLREKLVQADSEVSETDGEIQRIQTSMAQLDSELQKADERHAAVLERHSKIAERKAAFDNKIRLLTDKRDASRLARSKFQSEQAGADKVISESTRQRSLMSKEHGKMSKLLSRYERTILNHDDSVRELESRMGAHHAKRSKLQSEIEDIRSILEKSTRAAAQYETKIRVVKGMMHEDYSIAQLHGDGKRLGIDGLVYQLISWDKQYERAAMAAGADWIKAFVVRDLATLLGLAEVAREKNLPKLKIIPLEAIPDFGMQTPGVEGAVGILSDLVKARPGYDKLKTFLFGNVVLADTRDAAYRLSRAGYRAVTVNGELFEARAGVVVDINSKISKLTKIITLSSSVDGLLQSISLLKRYLNKKRQDLKRAEDAMSTTRERKAVSEKNRAATRQSYSDLKQREAEVSAKIASLAKRIGEHSKKRELLGAKASGESSYIELLDKRISMVRDNYAGGEPEGIARDLERIKDDRSSLATRHSEVTQIHSDHTAALAKRKAERSRVQERIDEYESDVLSMRRNLEDLRSEISKYEPMEKERRTKLVRLRQEEQDLIAASGTSVSGLEEYDSKLHNLRADEKALARRVAHLGRQHDSLSRDLKDLRNDQDQLKRQLDSLGFDEGVETFEARPLLAGLRAEQRSLTVINAKAPEKYLEESHRYRSMSERKNILEGERNSIVGLIEKIDKEKRQVFLDAFDKVDTEIRKIFSKMTGGTAWLELQNEDEIFSSGISYLIQFPNKPKRESASISGGEKTLAAIVFVLALQRLSPSPFYLFDEIDAHLDAPNSENLSRILAERAKESQFIMVSLKDSVVQKAKLIYGVYPKNGVSQVVTYKDRRVLSMAG